MSVFDPLHHDHINTLVNTPLITPLELQMVGGVSHENWGGVITPLGGLDKSLHRSMRLMLAARADETQCDTPCKPSYRPDILRLAQPTPKAITNRKLLRVRFLLSLRRHVPSVRARKSQP